MTPTQEEFDARHAAATVYLREQLCPDLNDDDAAAGERFWRELEAGRMPARPLGVGRQRTSEA